MQRTCRTQVKHVLSTCTRYQTEPYRTVPNLILSLSPLPPTGQDLQPRRSGCGSGSMRSLETSSSEGVMRRTSPGASTSFSAGRQKRMPSSRCRRHSARG